jgi:hypothetical protein
LKNDRRRELLGNRPKPKLRIGRVRNVPLDIRWSKRAFVNNFAILGDECGAVELPVLMRKRQHFLDFRGMVLGNGSVLGGEQKDRDT